MAFSGPVRRLVSRTAQVVPIDPHRGALSSLAFAGAVLDRGHGLIWFPEGGRSPTGELQPFRAGIGLLLKYFPVPVLPAVIRGSFEVMPLGRRLPRPGPVELHFGEILDPRQLADVGERSPRAIADALHEHVRGLQERAASPGPPREP
jgi:long-chain acyl-CoA synthetase